MANALQPQKMTVEGFLEWEAEQDGRHFLHDGRAFAMAGASRNHGSITPALTEICRRQLRDKPCRFRDDGTKVLVAETGATYYPDGLIACPPRYVSESTGTIDNPTVIFEVLSPSTARFDREGKFDAYRRLESLREYVLVHSDVVRVEVFTRQKDGKWGLSVYLAGSAVLESVEISLSLEEIYAEVDFAEEPPQEV